MTDNKYKCNICGYVTFDEHAMMMNRKCCDSRMHVYDILPYDASRLDMDMPKPLPPPEFFGLEKPGAGIGNPLPRLDLPLPQGSPFPQGSLSPFYNDINILSRRPGIDNIFNKF